MSPYNEQFGYFLVYHYFVLIYNHLFDYPFFLNVIPHTL